MDSLACLSRRAALTWPNSPALVFDATGDVLTFAQFDGRTNAIAESLRNAGVEAGDRVVVCSANAPLFPLAWFGILKAGAIMVPLNTAYRAEDAQHLLELAEPKAAFCDLDRVHLIAALQDRIPSLKLVIVAGAVDKQGWCNLDEFAPGLRDKPPAGQLSGDTVANIQFTSGTSGLPKGCVLTHRYWLELAGAVDASVISLSLTDATLTAQSFSYLDPQWAFVLTLLSGARLVVLDRFSPSRLWEKIVEHDVSFFYCLAAMPLMLLSCSATAAERAHRLRVIMCSAIPADRHGELEARFGVPWIEAYGATETGSDLGVAWADHAATIGSGTIGKALAHREAVIVDEAFQPVEKEGVGELLIRGSGMMREYWRNPVATADAFYGDWYRTGDLARTDAQGFFYLVGRRKDMIRRAGENIAAVEVENVLQQHPDVVLAACIAVPDPIRNEEIKVFVVRSADVDVESLAAFLEPRLARFKIPRFWSFVQNLPMTPSERVAKPLLSRDIGSDVLDRQPL